MAKLEPIIVDFETESIEKRPAYPPKPVGVALQYPGHPATYLAWGHPEGNNTTYAQAKARLKDIWRSGLPVCFHHSKFDEDVAQIHMGLPLLPWHLAHDTLFLIFLHDPHARSLSLKPSSERILGIKADARDDLKEWILANVKEAKANNWGGFICRAPGDLVGKYAAGDKKRPGDTEMTRRMFAKLYPTILSRGMGEAYDRERRLMPHLLESERTGLRVDLPRLRKDIPMYAADFQKAEAWIRKALKTPELNIDSGAELGAALLRSGKAKEANFLMTPSGKELSMGKESLKAAIKDPKLLEALGYRNRMMTCLNTFMMPWQRTAETTGGLVLPQWHQVRQGHGGDNDNSGARSGRIICTDPNLLNLSKNFEDKDDGYVHPKWLGVLELPLVRQYMLPDRGMVFGHRDYNQQELRILAHYEDGGLLRAYHDNPKLDVHDFVKSEIHRIMGLNLERRAVKTVNFGTIYGMGAGGTAEKLRTTVEKARELKTAQNRAVPGLAALQKGIKAKVNAGLPIVTWGGREYFCEPPAIVKGRPTTFEYKLLNYLIQGSAADNTKEAVIRYHEHPKRRDARFLVTVYDEVNASMPKNKSALAHEMGVLKDAMESVKFDVPMLSDGKVGPNWGALASYKD